MNNWKNVKLGDVCEIYNGSTPSKRKPEFWNGKIKWATPTDISKLNGKYISNTKDKITEEGLKSCSTRLIPKNSVLFTSRASIGHIAITKEEMCTNQGFKNFVCGKNILPGFLFYVLKINMPKIISLATGSTFKEVSMASIENLKIKLPPLPIQKQIISILEKAESLKQKREETNKETQTIIQSIFYEMFGSVENNYKKYPIINLGSIAKLQGGYAFKSKDYTSNGIHLVKITNVHFQKINWSEVNYLPNTFYEKYVAYQLHEGDVVLSMTRPVIKKLNSAKVVKIEKDDLPALLNQRVGRFVIDTKKANKEFILYYCYTSQFKKKIEQFGSVSLQPNVSSKQIESIELPLPPIKLQQEFAKRVQLIESIQSKQQSSTKEINTLFDALMQKAFKGELT